MRLTSFFAHKKAWEYSRRIILSWMKTMKCSVTIAFRILSQNINFELQMRVKIGLLWLTEVQKCHNYPHIGHILLIKSKMMLVQGLGTLNSSYGQRKNPQLPSLWAAAWNIRARLTLLQDICEGNLNFGLTDLWPKNICKSDKQLWECLSTMVCEILRVIYSP